MRRWLSAAALSARSISTCAGSAHCCFATARSKRPALPPAFSTIPPTAWPGSPTGWPPRANISKRVKWCWPDHLRGRSTLSRVTRFTPITASSDRCPASSSEQQSVPGRAAMTRRKSIHIGEFKHANPIPNACRIGNLLMSGVILGRDPATGKMPEKIEDQCANMFGHMKAIVEAGGGTTDDIIKMTVWLQDRTQRAPVNVEWLKMFPDEHSRPARHALQMDMENGALVQCDFTAVIG